MRPAKVNSVLELMKDSPLVRLRGRLAPPPRAALWAKLELALPGAMKDRVALQIIEDAERAGVLRPGGLIVESSSGTMAEGLARVGALKGYRIIIVTDPRIDALTVAKLEALGAELEIVETYHPQGGWQLSRLQRLRAVLERKPGAVWARQYDSPSNAAAYENVMAGELLSALGPNISAVVGSVGSGGSLCGTARALRKELPDLKVVAVDAVHSVLFHQPDGKRAQSGHGNSLIPGNVDYKTIDEAHWLADGEAFNGCRALARREGIFAGGSSGACYVVASWVAAQFEEGQNVVTLLPDRGDRYFETIYSDHYMREHGFAGVEAAAEPVRIRYGTDEATRWSYTPLPRDASARYHAPEIKQTSDVTRELGIR